VWVNGPFPCGQYSDLPIFSRNLKHLLLEGEKVIADRSYQDEKCVYFCDPANVHDPLFSSVRTRNETVNRRIKQFNVVNQKFRHEKPKHVN